MTENWWFTRGRPEEQVGAHCQNYNKHSIGICYIGGMTADNKKAIDTRTEAQKRSLRTLLVELKQTCPRALIMGHNVFANKSCPCFDAAKGVCRPSTDERSKSREIACFLFALQGGGKQ